MSQGISETTFAQRDYLIVRKKIEMKNISDKDLWEKAFEKTYGYAKENNVKIAGPGSAVYISWDLEKDTTDMGIGFPIEGSPELKDPELSIYRVEESKATTAVHRGPYDKLKETHEQLMNYMAANKLNPTISIEEYSVTEMEKPDPKDWETNLFYLHD